MNKIKDFLQYNSKLLLRTEAELLQYCTTESLDEDFIPKSAILLKLLDILPKHFFLRRKSFLESTAFSYFGDGDHVEIIPCTSVSRDVTFIKNISWLVVSVNVSQKVPYTGLYTLRVRVRVHKKVRWIGLVPMILKIEIIPITGEITTRNHFIHPGVWTTLCYGKHADLTYNTYNDMHFLSVSLDTSEPDNRDLGCAVDSNPRSLDNTSPNKGTWFFLKFDNIPLNKGDSVNFKIDDRQNVFYKSGISFDFVEILKKTSEEIEPTPKYDDIF